MQLGSGAFDGDAGLRYGGEEPVAAVQWRLSLSWPLTVLTGRSLLSRGRGVRGITVGTGLRIGVWSELVEIDRVESVDKVLEGIKKRGDTLRLSGIDVKLEADLHCCGRKKKGGEKYGRRWPWRRATRITTMGW